MLLILFKKQFLYFQLVKNLFYFIYFYFLFIKGLLQGGSDGVKSLILRYETLVQNKTDLQQRDFSKEKQERRLKLQQLILDHNTRIAKISTRIAQLHDQLNQFQRKESMREEKFINQIDIKRTNVIFLI